MATRAGIKINAAEALGALRSLRLKVADRRKVLNAIGDRQLKFVSDNFSCKKSAEIFLNTIEHE